MLPCPERITEHFLVSEFACRCCKTYILDRARLVCSRLENVRSMYGPLVLISGHRCTVQNKRVGGEKGSMHLESMAVDIRVGRDSDRYHLVQLLMTFGFTGIGVGRDMVHADLRNTLVPGTTPMMWVYPLPQHMVDV